MSSFGYDLLGFGSSANTAVDLPSDDEFNRVSFLSHFDGANSGNNSVYDDGSTSNHTITQNGRVWQGSFSPFARPDGEWGVAFDDSDLGLDGNALYALNDEDYTMEAWVFVNNANGNYVYASYENTNGGELNVIGIYNGSTTNFLFGRTTTPSQTVTNFSDKTFDSNTWTHIAVVRSNSGTVKVYVNGVVSSTTVSMTGSAYQVRRIGGGRGQSGTANLFNGNISNVRYSSVARYTSNFTPPTTPFSSDSDTNTLACQSNRFVDNSSNARAVTPTGTTAVSAFGPFLTDAAYDPAVNGASAYFGGSSGDYLSFSHASDFAFGTGDFTIEWWSWGGTGNAQYIYQGSTSSSTYHQLIESNGSIMRYYPTAGSNPMHDTGWGAIVQNAWTHYAVARTSGTTNLYKNGARVLTASGSPSNSNILTTIARIGAATHGSGWLGYISDFRVVKGTAVYTGTTYTVPTAPLTAITNTKLLLNMANGQIIDNAAQSIAREVGSPVISTAQAKFGNTSLSVSGSSSVKFNEGGYSGFAFGTGDFTIEFWYYGDSTQNDYLFDTRLANDNEARASVYFNSNSKLSYYTSNTTRITSTTALTNNTWTHIALVRSSAVTRFYFNGTQDNQSFSDTLDMPSAQLVIGSKWNGTAFVTGYFDDFRVSKMARYTGNFTAPAEPFADKGQ